MAQVAERPDGICGDLMPAAIDRTSPGEICRLPFGHKSRWHEALNEHRTMWQHSDGGTYEAPVSASEASLDPQFLAGYRQAITDLRDDAVFAVWADQHLDVNNPEDWPIDLARITLADFLASRLSTEGSTDG